MNRKEIEALEVVIKYIIENEQKHWQENNQPANHIYNFAVILQNYLSQRKN